MFTTIELAKKIIESLAKWTGKKLERNHKVLKLLKAIGIGALEDKFDSIYNHTLVAMMVEKERKSFDFQADNQYRISHKSLRDYLTAQAFVKEIDSGKIEHFARNRTTEEINHFILEQNPGKDVLLDLVLTARDLQEERQWQGTNAAVILLQIDNTILKSRDLSRCQLSYVNFGGCDLSGAKFQNANLGNFSFTRSVLSAIFQGTNVENSGLYLSFCKLKDIQFLKEFKGLTHLELGGNQLTDIAPIRELKNLTDLDLSENQITDISPIRELKCLTMLWINHNLITNLSVLKELKNLRHLFLHKNQMDEKQKAGLKKVIPGLEIDE